jgi:hypothetical protein
MARVLKLTLVFGLSILCVSLRAQEQKKKEAEFPNNEEIRLVVIQSERAFEQYGITVTMEEQLPSAKNNPSFVEKDRQVYDMASKLIAALKINPDAFHGPGGLLLLTSLDDASRNAALCSGTAYNDSMQTLMASSDVHRATDSLNVGLNCAETSGHIYTVSESVNALLLREMEAQQSLNRDAGEALDRCTAALKNCDSHGH